jgi:polyisoprenoid-binding protein YceI
MRTSKTRTLWALALAPAFLAWTPAQGGITLQPESRLWIEGTSTVRGFTCKATAFDAQIEAASSGAPSAVLTGSKAVGSVAVDVQANKLDCGNGKMNEHMLKALRVEQHPTIAFRLGSYELARSGAQMQVLLNGTLTMGGVEKPVAFTALATEGPNGALRVTGSHTVNMKEFGLKPPTLMMGTMRVNEKVKVAFDLLLKE